MFFPVLLGKMGHTVARRSKTRQNGYPSHVSAALEFEMSQKRSPPEGATSTRNGLWRDGDKPRSTRTPWSNVQILGKPFDAYGGGDTGNISDGDQGSDYAILRNSRSYDRMDMGNDIIRTTEIMVEPSIANASKNPVYYPG